MRCSYTSDRRESAACAVFLGGVEVAVVHVRRFPSAEETAGRRLEASLDVVLEVARRARVRCEVLLELAVHDEIGERRRFLFRLGEWSVRQFAHSRHLALRHDEGGVDDLVGHLTASQFFGSLASPPLNFILPCLNV
jgi:hypothetical protein